MTIKINSSSQTRVKHIQYILQHSFQRDAPHASRLNNLVTYAHAYGPHLVSCASCWSQQMHRDTILLVSELMNAAFSFNIAKIKTPGVKMISDFLLHIHHDEDSDGDMQRIHLSFVCTLRLSHCASVSHAHQHEGTYPNQLLQHALCKCSLVQYLKCTHFCKLRNLKNCKQTTIPLNSWPCRLRSSSPCLKSMLYKMHG